MQEAEMLREMLREIRRVGMLVASEDIRDGTAYDPEYTYERAEAFVTAYGEQAHVPGLYP